MKDRNLPCKDSTWFRNNKEVSIITLSILIIVIMFMACIAEYAKENISEKYKAWVHVHITGISPSRYMSHYLINIDENSYRYWVDYWLEKKRK